MTQNTWENMMEWAFVTPPSRPAKWQLDSIRVTIGHIDRTKPVGVLGSTPEFRDLLAEMRFAEIHVLERNELFHERLRELRIHNNEETVLWGDWLETLPGIRNKFSLLLSDLTSGNIPYEKRGMFYDFVSRALGPGGLFIDRVLTHPIAHERLDTLDAKYSDEPLNLLTVNNFSCEYLFCSELLERQVLDSTEFYKLLEQRFRNERLRRFLDECKRVTPEDCLWWYGRPWAALEQQYLAPWAEVTYIEEPEASPYVNRARLYCLRS